MDSTLLRFFQQDKDLITDNRPLRLRLAHSSKVLEDVLLPQKIQGGESICGGIEYHILCVSLDAFIPLKELIALPAAVDIVTERGELRSICGIVTEAFAGDSDGGLASYQLVMRDALAIMEKRNNTRVFRDKNEVEIVQVILDEWLANTPVIGTCFSYEIDLPLANQPLPRREFTMQYNESDATFIHRLLKRSGIAWFYRAKQSDYPSHTLFLFNRSTSLQQCHAANLRYHRDNAAEERDAITSWCAARTLQAGRSTRFSWNYRDPWSGDFMWSTAMSRSNQGDNGNYVSASLDDCQVLAPHAGDDYDDLCRLGELAIRRHDYLSKCFHGEGTARDLQVGEYFMLDGHPEIDQHADAEREFVVTSLQLDVSNNLSNQLAKRAERLFIKSRWVSAASCKTTEEETRVRVNFSVVRRGIEIAPSYDPRIDLPLVPMQSAIVVGPDGEEVYCDPLGRVKIRFQSTKEADHRHAQGAGAANTEMDSAWVRVASGWAGNWPGHAGQCGTLTLPRVGSEVLIAFLGGEPDKPVIVGQLYNQRGQPPAFSNVGDLPGNRYLSGIKSREIKKGRSNQLLFDDTQGEISVQLASEHKESHLNLGYISEPRKSGQGRARGEGAELRTEGHIALRAGRGLLLTAWRKEAGSILGRAEMAKVMDECSELAKAIGMLAEKCRALKIERDSIDHLLESVKRWDGDNAPASIGITSPAGISITTPKAIANYAGEDAETAAHGNLSMTAGQRACINAGKGLSLFSQSDGLSAIAQQGKLLLQSQGGNTEVNAATDLMLTASEGKVIAMGKEIVLVAEDGSFIKIGGGITLGTNGTIAHYGASFPFKGPKSMSTQLPTFDNCKTQIKFQGKYYANRGEESIAASGSKIEIRSTDGSQCSEKSDEAGRTSVMESDTMHSAIARVIQNGSDAKGRGE
ncbi:type VI secretion system Vgr family protein [Duganella sp. Root1480D1]|uniref:type VI secretion system Vgr family protein n=1 Tax=Duganella sp. Root1480D1 TaxID=1736471 RepID=UPI000AA35D0F|nr:type VI secretion system Vgr family protein [Duganella sp. Root1480D1]